MKKIICWTMVLGLSFATVWLAHAVDVKHVLPIAAAMGNKETQGKLDGSVKFFFAKEKTPQALEHVRSEVGLGKAHNSDPVEKSCNAAFLMALTRLQNRAKQLKTAAIVNIVSAFKGKPELSSPTEFECYTGARTTSVTLRGDIVKLADK